jgi:hypothetical protein
MPDMCGSNLLVPYHVMSRGTERAAITRDDEHREVAWLHRKTFGRLSRVFILTPSHEHLIVETPDPIFRPV